MSGAPMTAVLQAMTLPDWMTLGVADATSLPLDEGTVNLIVTSPPYGLDKPYRGLADPSEGWDQLIADFLPEASRILADRGRLAVNVPFDVSKPSRRSPFAILYQTALAVGLQFKCGIIWNEGNVSRSVARGSVDSPNAPHVIARVETVAIFSKGIWNRGRPGTPSDLTHDEWLTWTNGLWSFPGESRPWEGHPAAFPLELPRRLMTLLSFPDDVICDPFLGSGTSAVAAYRLGRRFYGFDLSPAYVASSHRRLAKLGTEGRVGEVSL
jgi:site-specific DNA-methyltransferase (adenine-specific)